MAAEVGRTVSGYDTGNTEEARKKEKLQVYRLTKLTYYVNPNGIIHKTFQSENYGKKSLKVQT